MEKKAAVILLSGGQDSTTCLWYAKQHYDHCYALSLDYGQRHRHELEAARYFANLAQVQAHQILDLSALNQIAESSLTRWGEELPNTESASSTQTLNTFVPGRNLIFLSFAATYAYQVGAEAVIIGACEVDYSGYPDCRARFIRKLNQAVCLGLEKKILFVAPLMYLDKAEVWALAQHYGIFESVKSHSVTCYAQLHQAPCGRCPACQLRETGLKNFLARPKACLESAFIQLNESIKWSNEISDGRWAG